MLGVDIVLGVVVVVFPDVVVLVEEVLRGLDPRKEGSDLMATGFLTVDTRGEFTLGVGFALLGFVEEVLRGLDLCKEDADLLSSGFLTVDTLGEFTLGVGFALIGFELDETGLFFFPTSSSAFPPTAFGAVFRPLTAAFPAEADLDPDAGLLVSGFTESFFSWSFSSM